MSKKMLIDASHPEETRVVVVDGTRVEELDFESQNKRQLRGNVYLARVTRVEPSLQAAFVEFGGNRHGFLAFGEIHPDYYDLPHEDRMALLEAEAQDNLDDNDDDDDDESDAGESAPAEAKGESKSKSRRRRRSRNRKSGKTPAESDDQNVDSASAQDIDEDEDEGEDPLRPAASSHGMANRRKEKELPPVKAAVKTSAKKVKTSAKKAKSKDSESAPKDSKAKDTKAEDAKADKPKRTRRKAPAKPKSKRAQPARAPKGPSISEPAIDDTGEDENTPDPTRKAATSWNVASKLVFSNFDIEKDPTSPAADNFKHAESLKVAEYDPSIIPEDDDDDESTKTTAKKSRSKRTRRRGSKSGKKAREQDTGDLDTEILEDAADEDDKEVAEEQAKMDRKRKQRLSRRRYKIQEVIKRGQIMLVQAVKEERGGKGAALTTYLSLAGRYCVLMPNTPRGGGISRKISNGSDRKRLKSIMSSLDVPKGMGVIVRTAGAKRSETEITRDYDYLAKLWETIRNNTLKSFAPALIHQEGDLVKRSIRDMFNKDISEILVSGDAAYQDAHNFVDMLMPEQIDRVKKYEDDIPLFLRYQVEQQIEASLEPVAQLKSGGYLVIHPTEALVSVDVNSGRSTKERNVERTALKTNLEAAEEVARQMRLRDLAGLVVIDFIDMDESRNNRAVESRMKDALSRDRARVQMGRISQFGLMEISRQRRRRSLLEGSSASCEHCGGVGRKRSVESSALKAIRAVEEEGVRGKAKRIRLRVSPNVALYLFNEKRDMLHKVDDRMDMFTEIVSDDTLHRPGFEIERVEEREDKRSDPLEAIKQAAKSENKRRNERRPKSDRNDDDGGNRKRGGRNRKRDQEAKSSDNDSAKPDVPNAEDGEAGEQPRKRRRRRGRRGGRSRNKDTAQEAGNQETGNQETGNQESGNQESSAPSDSKSITEKPAEDSKPAKAKNASKAKADKAGTEGKSKESGRKRRRRKAPSSKDEGTDSSVETEAQAQPESQIESEADAKPKDSKTSSKPRRVRAKAPAPKRKASESAAADSSVKSAAPAQEDGPKPSKAKTSGRSRVRAKAPAPKKKAPKKAAKSDKTSDSSAADPEPSSSASPSQTESKKGKKGWLGKMNPFKD